MKQVVQTVLTGDKRDKVMANDSNSQSEKAQPLIYQIRVKGHLGQHFTDWFEGFTITAQDRGSTLLTGPVVDQAALHGLLRKVRDLAMPLISVICVKPDPTDASDLKQDMNDEMKANLEETYGSTTWGSNRVP